jgi:hypothetical protein
MLDAREQEEQVPAAVIAGKGVQFVHHDRAHVTEQCGDRHPRRDHHCFQRLRRCQQQVGRVVEDMAA